MPLVRVYRDNAKAILDVETTTGQVKQAQSVVPPMERLVQGLEKQQADTLKSVSPCQLVPAHSYVMHVLLMQCAASCFIHAVQYILLMLHVRHHEAAGWYVAETFSNRTVLQRPVMLCSHDCALSCWAQTAQQACVNIMCLSHTTLTGKHTPSAFHIQSPLAIS